MYQRHARPDNTAAEAPGGSWQDGKLREHGLIKEYIVLDSAFPEGGLIVAPPVAVPQPRALTIVPPSPDLPAGILGVATQKLAPWVKEVDFRHRHITVTPLVRIAALILLLGMIPRVVTAIPVGSALCWADDHLILDCHAAVDPPDCGDEPAPGDSDAPKPCLDLIGTATGVAPANGTPQLDRPEFTLAPWPATPARAIGSIGAQAEPIGQPPWRCDGFHSRSISRLC